MASIAPRLLSQADAAAYIGRSVRKLQQLAADGEITPRYLDSKPSYLREELDEFIDSLPTEKRAS